jgi:hypothetical protein
MMIFTAHSQPVVWQAASHIGWKTEEQRATTLLVGSNPERCFLSKVFKVLSLSYASRTQSKQTVSVHRPAPGGIAGSLHHPHPSHPGPRPRSTRQPHFPLPPLESPSHQPRRHPSTASRTEKIEITTQSPRPAMTIPASLYPSLAHDPTSNAGPDEQSQVPRHQSPQFPRPSSIIDPLQEEASSSACNPLDAPRHGSN